MSTKQRIVAWLDLHERVFGELSEAVTQVTQAGGRAGDTVTQSGKDAPEAVQALGDVQAAARHLLATARAARGLPAIPDASTQGAFDAALGRWIDAAESIDAAAARRDGPGLKQAARGLEAGTAEFLRSAAALRRATGQAPDPNNPYN